MFLSIFVSFGLLLNAPYSLEIQDVALPDIIIDHNVTGVLGEEVHLHCLYSGKHKISDSSWKLLDSGNRARMMAGYKNGKPFAKDNFSTPTSYTNLTVKVSINSLELEGVYTCVFSTDDEEIMENMQLTVIARPHVNIYTEEDNLNGTLYQNIFCTASCAKPSASLYWDIHGAPLNEDIFSIHNTRFTLPNGTVSIVSMLRFPIHMNNESSVACVVQHPAMAEPYTALIKLHTFVSPNVTMKMALVEKEGKAFTEVSCKAKGGMPHPSITWIKPESANTSCTTHFITFEMVSSTYCFPLDVYESENITCIFGYPLSSAIVKTVTLPTYYVNSLQLTNTSITMNHLNTSGSLILEEEDSDIRISMKCQGNVLRYTMNCTKDGDFLSEAVNCDSNCGCDLIIKGPVGSNHAGQYQCKVSYYRYTASLQFEIEVKPRIQVPAPINMSLLSNTSWENGIQYTEVKCMAENVSPDADITWDTGDCRSVNSASESGNVSGSQHDYSVVWITARLPVYTYSGCTIICVVHYHGLKKPLKKSIHIPLTEPPRSNVSIDLQKDSTHWTALCKYESSWAITNISWVISDTNASVLPSTTVSTTEGSMMITMCIYKFELCQHEGILLTCVIETEYGVAERRTILVPNFFISSIMILNKTVPLYGSHGKHTGLHRVALKDQVSNQRILFRVNGNASACNIKCFRSNGIFVHTEGTALVFPHYVSESDADLYTCSVSWYHPNVTVTVLVDVTRQEIYSMIVILICFSSAIAMSLILMITLCIFCKRNEETYSSSQDWKKHESLASLMQNPRSPELKKARVQRQEYAELVDYVIVIDVKSRV